MQLGEAVHLQDSARFLLNSPLCVAIINDTKCLPSLVAIFIEHFYSSALPILGVALAIVEFQQEIVNCVDRIAKKMCNDDESDTEAQRRARKGGHQLKFRELPDSEPVPYINEWIRGPARPIRTRKLLNSILRWQGTADVRLATWTAEQAIVEWTRCVY